MVLAKNSSELNTIRKLDRRASLLLGDSAIWVLATLVAVVLRFEFDLTRAPFGATLALSSLLVLVSAGTGFLLHLYRNRYVVGSLDEVKNLALNALVVTVVVGTPLVFLGNSWGLPRSIVLIATPMFFLLSGGFRAYLRLVRVRDIKLSAARRNAVIYGAGTAAEALIPQLLALEDALYSPVVLLDDAPQKANRWIRGVPMGGQWQSLPKVVEKYKVDTVIVAIPSATSELLSRVYADASRFGLQVVVLPSLQEYLGGRTTPSELRNVSIEDLLGRQSVELDSGLITTLIKGRRVLVTGAGGSIGSELSRIIADYSPASLTLVDRDETGLLSASMGIPTHGDKPSHETYLADIRDKSAVHELFKSRKPDVVFHAAALKHLPILEAFPAEAWKTNVQGTLNILEAAQQMGVSGFVNISTDKAANPANALGRSKKLGEELTAWFGEQSRKPYVSVRFGNVLGSRGSLIPVIAEQIEAGGPVTITDKMATRYFMSISEACQLVLQAAALGEGGDVMVLDMGVPVNINEIAERMIELSGKNVVIEYIGLRPGEKLHEDLLSESESPLPSQHPRILRLKATPSDPSSVLASPWL
jgi:dTDP-glucose 4,6-dehydratase